MGHLNDMLAATVTEIVVVRHGQTVWNATDRIQGHEESDLSEAGIQQARAVADRLARHARNISAVYSSDLKRASATAQIIAERIGGLAVVELESLRERHLGKLQGLTRAEAELEAPESLRALFSSDLDEPIPGGGESMNQLYSRTKSAMEEIALKHLGQRIVLVSHGGVLRALYKHAKDCQPPGRVRNTSVNVFRISHARNWSLRLWGDVNHLQGTDLAKAGQGGDEMR